LELQRGYGETMRTDPGERGRFRDACKRGEDRNGERGKSECVINAVCLFLTFYSHSSFYYFFRIRSDPKRDPRGVDSKEGSV
jgi:hypothetical protein